MTGYSPALRALAQKGRLDLMQRLLAAHPDMDPDLIAAMSRDGLIAALLPPSRRGRTVRPYPREASWR